MVWGYKSNRFAQVHFEKLTKMSNIKWAAFKWFIRDSTLAVLHCFIQWPTVLPLLPTNPQKCQTTKTFHKNYHYK